MTASDPVHLRICLTHSLAMPMDDLWGHLLASCKIASRATCVGFHALVLMSNHVHLIVSSRTGPISMFIEPMLFELQASVNWTQGPASGQWGMVEAFTPIHRRIYYWNALKYVYRNPVEAGLCDRVESYPYSSIHAYLNGGTKGLPFPLEPWKWEGDWLRWGDRNAVLTWLNGPLSSCRG